MTTGNAPKGGDRSPSLTQDHVVSAALAFIDEHGLESFSMRNLARELGVYPTAVYWHAGNREALLAMAIGRALFEIEAPDELEEWDDWLIEFARRFRANLHEHPNLASIVGTQMVSNAVTEFQVIEVMLAKLSVAGFAGDELVNAYNVIVGCVVGFVGLELARVPDEDSWACEMEAGISEVDRAFYPHLAANAEIMANRSFGLRWVRGTEAPLDEGFEVMLSVIFDGLRRRLPGR